MGGLVASNMTTYTQFNGGSTANSMTVHNIADNCELIPLNYDASDADPIVMTGNVCTCTGNTMRLRFKSVLPKDSGALPLVQAYTVACRWEVGKCYMSARCVERILSMQNERVGFIVPSKYQH